MTDVEWSRLRHATGTCEGIPAALEALCSADAEQRKSGYWKIDNYVVLQGDLHEAAPFVVRGLLDCLEAEPPSKVEIYDLLIELGNGHAPESELVEIDGKVVPIKAATQACLEQGMTRYWRDLDKEPAEIRTCVAWLFLALSDHMAIDKARLRTFWESEADAKVRSLFQEVIEHPSYPSFVSVAHEGWAITLQIADDERLEDRAAAVVAELARVVPAGRWLLDDLEATGERGSAIDVAPGGEVELGAAALLAVLDEDGQVIELGATLRDGEVAVARLDIRDGDYVDVGGPTPPLPASVLGPHRDVVMRSGPWNQTAE